MTIRMSDLLVEIASKKLDMLLEQGQELTERKHLPMSMNETDDDDNDEVEQEVKFRDPETGRLGTKKVKVTRDKSMHSTSKATAAADAEGTRRTGIKKLVKALGKKPKERIPTKGGGEYGDAMRDAKQEFKDWEKKKKEEKKAKRKAEFRGLHKAVRKTERDAQGKKPEPKPTPSIKDKK